MLRHVFDGGFIGKPAISNQTRQQVCDKPRDTTMGPPIAPHIWNVGLDGGIRISTIVIGVGSCAAILLWFFWTLCCDVYRFIIRTK